MATRSAGVLALLLMTAFAFAARPVVDVAKRGQNVLAVLGRGQTEASFSKFFGGLKQSGFALTVKEASDKTLQIAEYDLFIYDHIILLGVTGEVVGANLNAAQFVNFINDGGNLIVAGKFESSDLGRELASQAGVEYDAPGTSIIDHFNFVSDLDGGKHTTVFTTSEGVTKNQFIFPQPISGPIITEGPAVAPGIDFAFTLVRGQSTSYAGSVGKPLATTPFALGKLVGIAVAVQAHNNARAVFTGSAELFSNTFFDTLVNGQKSGNEAFSAAVAKWTFQQTGVIRISNPKHSRANSEGKSLSWYRINDDMIYQVDIEQRSGNSWVAFKADDVQMEAVMLDPYLRVNFEHDNQGNFTASFKLPDVYGMFTLAVKYYRRGLSHLETADIISVRPFRHNEYERFIPAAYPYYSSAFIMIIGVVLFSFVFLYHKDQPAQQTSSSGGSAPATPVKVKSL